MDRVLLMIFAAIFLLWQWSGPTEMRWREYLFIATVVAGALAYGVIDGFVCSRVSWEYFYYPLPFHMVPDPEARSGPALVQLAAIKEETKNELTLGLLLGAGVLTFNSPSLRDWPQLSYRRLLPALVIIFVHAIGGAVLGGVAGWYGWIPWWAADLSDWPDFMRPRHVFCTFGVSFGGELGAVFGMVGAMIWIHFLRKREAFALAR